MIQQKVNILFNNTILNGNLVDICYNVLTYENSFNKKIKIVIKWGDDNRGFRASYDTIEDLKTDVFSTSESCNTMLPGIDIITPSGARYPIIFNDNLVDWAKAVDCLNKDIAAFQSKELELLVDESWE